jgi:hypothetical protein
VPRRRYTRISCQPCTTKMSLASRLLVVNQPSALFGGSYPMLSFNDQELAALRTAAAALPPGQRDRFLRTVARALGCCVAVGPSTVAQIAVAVQQRLLVNDGSPKSRRRRPTLAEPVTSAPASRVMRA